MIPTLRKRIFAWMMRKSDAASHTIYRAHKEELFRGLKGNVVEVGPGSGINFRYFPPGITWTGIEPNESFAPVLEEESKKYGIRASLLQGTAESIPLPDRCADAVICTLVLCSVDDPVQATAEMKRILKPNGTLLFIEHVAAPYNTFLRRVQNAVNPVNRLTADGCNCNRETWAVFRDAGFSRLEIVHEQMKGVFPIHSPHIVGKALK